MTVKCFHVILPLVTLGKVTRTEGNTITNVSPIITDFMFRVTHVINHYVFRVLNYIRCYFENIYFPWKRQQYH